MARQMDAIVQKMETEKLASDETSGNLKIVSAKNEKLEEKVARLESVLQERFAPLNATVDSSTSKLPACGTDSVSTWPSLLRLILSP